MRLDTAQDDFRYFPLPEGREKTGGATRAEGELSIGANPGMAAATSGTVGPNPLRYCSVAKIGTWRIAAP
jgi:hypothetical protein